MKIVRCDICGRDRNMREHKMNNIEKLDICNSCLKRIIEIAKREGGNN